MIGDQAYFMGRAAARFGTAQRCPFAAETAQGRSWRRGWREINGADHVEPLGANEEDLLLERLEALPRRVSLAGHIPYWRVTDDFDLITLSRLALSAQLIAERIGRTTYAVNDRREYLRKQGFAPDMLPARQAA